MQSLCTLTKRSKIKTRVKNHRDEGDAQRVVPSGIAPAKTDGLGQILCFGGYQFTGVAKALPSDLPEFLLLCIAKVDGDVLT